jgi:sec-independent protein translocase protein TatC
LVIIASMISPPEFISHISVAIPLILIYEISVLVSKVVYKRKQKRQEGDINLGETLQIEV